jgi:hypothetical protein
MKRTSSVQHVKVMLISSILQNEIVENINIKRVKNKEK